MAEEHKGNGIFWALLLLVGGAAVYGINKAFGNSNNGITFPNIFGIGKNNTTLPNVSTTTKPTVDKYAYGSSTMDGAQTSKNSNTDIVFTISDMKNTVIVGQLKNRYNDYVLNIGISNKLSTSITIEHIVLLFYLNGSFKGYYEFSQSSTNPLITLKPKSGIGKTVTMFQSSYTRDEDLNKINLVDTYFDENPQKLLLRKSTYNSGYHWVGGDIIDPITGAHSPNPNPQQVEDYSPDYVIDKTDKSYLEDLWMNKYTLNVKGFVVYRKYENDVWDGGNIAYLYLTTNHSAETTKAYPNRMTEGSAAGGGSGSSTTSKSKLGITNFID